MDLDELFQCLRDMLAEEQKQTVLLEEIAEAFRPSEEPEPVKYTCRCTTGRDAPVSNCPICGGTGQT